jgi:hypothetical protein
VALFGAPGTNARRADRLYRHHHGDDALPGDKAFRLLAAQSQAENRKLVDIAGEIAAHMARRAAPPA